VKFKEAVVVDAVRSPFGRAGDRGVFRALNYLDIAFPVFKTLVERNNLDPNLIDEIIMGSVGLSGALTRARSVVFELDWPISIAAHDLNRQCGSAVQSVATAANAIMCDGADILLAGGWETMDRIGPVPPEQIGRRGAAGGGGTAQRGPKEEGYPPDWKFANLADEWYKKVEPWIYDMGRTAEKLAGVYNISRHDADVFSLNSHLQAIAAQDAGLFKDEIVPITINYRDGTQEVVDVDQCPRRGTTLDRIESLPPSYVENGLVTAGNSCPRTDGVTLAIIMSKDKAKELGYKPMVTIRQCTVAGVDPTIMGIGPLYATKKLLQRTGMSIDDFGLIEINEAFACQVVACIRELGIQEERVNVKGGAVAMGHPLGATGTRLVGTLAREMIRRDVEWGLVTLCCGGGQGMALALQRENYD
jgi:acetyl-CoA acetyltransferase family protein